MAVVSPLRFARVLTESTVKSFRNFCTPTQGVPAVDNVEDVVFQRIDTKRIITLNRPGALNSLNLSMIRKIYPKLKKWESSEDDVDVVMLKGHGEKAFCAGGDVRSIAESGIARRKGQAKETLTEDFFREEYMLNYLIGTYKIPYVAFIDGITMGGGVGLSVHGLYRVATEKTVFAMPETAIGFFPDVGGSYFLPRLKHENLGMYLALAGHRLTGHDVLHAGVATHFVRSEHVADLERQLMIMPPERCDANTVGLILAEYEAKAALNPKFSLEPHLPHIAKLFSGDSVEAICESLTRDGSDWAKKQKDLLLKMSPTSLKVTHKQIKMGANLDLKSCLELEYRICQRFMENHDFFEGVRAALIDKDRSPKWKPEALKDVTKESVDSYFQPLPAARELVLVH